MRLALGEYRVVRAGETVGAAGEETARRLDAGGDEAVALAGADGVGGHPDGLQRRRAVAVDGDAGHVLEAGEDGHDASDVEPRLAGRLSATEDEVLDLRRRQVRDL